jgi:cytoskeletal protein CcmA (bactofilin family)
MRATDAALPGLRLDGTKLQKLDAERLNIGGSLFFRGAIAVQEEVRLDGAKVGGNLDCDGGLFGAPLARSDADRPERIEVALSAEGIIVRGDVLLGNGFCARGGVRLTGARIKGNLTCSQGCFDAVCAQDQIRDPDDPVVALSADRMLVKGNVFFNEGFEARGGVRLVGAHIEGSLDCSGSKFTGPEGCEVIDAQRMVVDGRFEADESTFEGLANLSAAKVGSLADSPKSWRDNSLRLDGFHYDRISESADAVARIAWLRKQIDEHVKADFRPQPWEQLITAMRAMGHPGEASKIAIAKEKARGKSAQMRPIWRGPQKLKKLAKWQEWARTVHRSIHWFFGAFARFGYSPLRTFFWISFLWALCSFYFADARDNGLFGPTAPAIQLSEALQSCGGPGKIFWTSVECKLPAEYTAFDPWLYSLDLILPFVDLQQESNWAPITSTDAGRALSSGWALRWLMWIEIIFGWLMSLLLLTALGRLLNRD